MKALPFFFRQNLQHLFHKRTFELFAICGHFLVQSLLGWEGGFTRFFCDSLFVIHGCAMDLEWCPERYDLISDYRIFAVTWCLWDWTPFSSVLVFSYLEVGDIRCFCCSAYCIYLDFGDICLELDKYHQSLKDG